MQQPHVDFSYVGAKLAKALHKQPGPRLFTLEYDSSKIKTKNAFNLAQFKKRRSCEGTLYSNGAVTLDNGTFFQNMAEVRDHFAQMGTATLTWSDTGDVEEIG